MLGLLSVNTCGMKRFWITAVLIVVVVGAMLCFVPQSMSKDALNYVQYNPTVNVYCRKTSLSSIDLGLGRQVTCTLADLADTLANCDNVDGISVCFDGTAADVCAIVNRLHAAEVNCQQLDDMFVACYYSPLIRERATIDGKSVNLQIAYHNGTITVGYPLILGSY